MERVNFRLENILNLTPQVEGSYQDFINQYGDLFPELGIRDYINMAIDENSREDIIQTAIELYSDEYLVDNMPNSPQNIAVNNYAQEFEDLREALLNSALELADNGTRYVYTMIGNDGVEVNREIVMRQADQTYKDKALRPVTYHNFGYAILSNALGNNIRKNEAALEVAQGSDVNEWINYNTISPDIFEDGNVPLNDIENNRVGVFKKKWPRINPNGASSSKNPKLFGFNDEERNIYCLLTALSYQDKNDYLHMIKTEEGINKAIINCGFNMDDNFIMTEDNIQEYYKSFAKFYNLTMKIYLRVITKDKVLEKLNQRKLGNNTKDTISYTEYWFYEGVLITKSKKKQYKGKNIDSVMQDRTNDMNKNKFHIALLGNHMFNLDSINSQYNIDIAMRYLQYICLAYDTLEDRYNTVEIRNIIQENKQKYKETKDKIEEDPNLLLDYLSKDSKYNYELSSNKPKVANNQCVFIIDFETYSRNNNIYIYSYVCTPYIDTYKDKKLSNVIYMDTTVYKDDKITNNNRKMVKKMLDGIINQVPYSTKLVLYAHFGSGFDNLLIKQEVLSMPGVRSPKDIYGGNSMVSFSFTYYPKHNVKNEVYYIELRDSLKILDTGVANLPANYGLKTYKMDFPYALYQYYYDIYEGNSLKGILFEEENQLIEGCNKAKEHACKGHDCTKNITKNEQGNYIVNEENYNKSGNCINCKIIDDFMVSYFRLLLSYKQNKNLDIIPDDNMKEDLTNYFNTISKNGKIFDLYHFNIVYNKYDCYIVRDALKAFKQYLSIAATKENYKAFLTSEISKITDINKKERLTKELDRDFEPLEVLANIEPTNYRTISSIVNDIMFGAGVYDNVYVLKGALKQFVQKSIVGGRVQLNQNKNLRKFESVNYNEIDKYINQEATKENIEKILELATTKEGAIVDFDAVSLYPTAISQCRMPIGEPIAGRLNNMTQKEFDSRISKYPNCKFFICCDLKTNRNLDFPILSKVEDYSKEKRKVFYNNNKNQTRAKISGGQGKVRNFKDGEYKNKVIGDILYYDLIKYQDVEITAIHSLVLFKDSSTRFSKVIKTIFSTRVILKMLGSASNNLFKLIMNSAYGRTILKDDEYKQKYLCNYEDKENNNKMRIDRFRSIHSAHIKSEAVRVGNWTKFYLRNAVNDYKGMPHIGSTILEKSKSIMTEVFVVLQQNNYNVYYTDTDSIHTDANALQYLENFIGSEMGKFHSDFEARGAKSLYSNNTYNNVRCNLMGLFAVRSYFIGKKSYYDKLLGINQDNKFQYFEHKRMKGAISSELNEDSYIHMLNGGVVQQDITKKRFKTRKDNSINCRDSGMLYRNDKLMTVDSNIRLLTAN